MVKPAAPKSLQGRFRGGNDRRLTPWTNTWYIYVYTILLVEF